MVVQVIMGKFRAVNEGGRWSYTILQDNSQSIPEVKSSKTRTFVRRALGINAYAPQPASRSVSFKEDFATLAGTYGKSMLLGTNILYENYACVIFNESGDVKNSNDISNVISIEIVNTRFTGINNRQYKSSHIFRFGKHNHVPGVLDIANLSSESRQALGPGRIGGLLVANQTTQRLALLDKTVWEEERKLDRGISLPEALAPVVIPRLPPIRDDAGSGVVPTYLAGLAVVDGILTRSQASSNLQSFVFGEVVSITLDQGPFCERLWWDPNCFEWDHNFASDNNPQGERI